MRRALLIAAALALLVGGTALARDVLKADQDYGSAWRILNLQPPATNGEPIRRGDMPGSGLPCILLYNGGAPLFQCAGIGTGLSLSGGTLSLTAIPANTSVLGELLFTAASATVTPPAGFGRCRFDAANRDWTCIDAYGLETHGVRSSVGANFITGIAPDGTVTRSGVSATQVAGLYPVALTGNGSDLNPASTPLDRLSQSGATTGQVPAWDGTAWVPATAATGGITQLTGQVLAGPGSGSQATTLATNTVTLAQMQQLAGLSLLGRSANSTGNMAAITATSGSNGVLRESGGALGFGSVSASVLSGFMPCSNLSPLTGDVTSVGCATTVVNLPNGATWSGWMHPTNTVVAGTPAAGTSFTWVDATAKTLFVREDGGNVSHTVRTSAAGAHQFANGLSDAGALAYAQPVEADVVNLTTDLGLRLVDPGANGLLSRTASGVTSARALTSPNGTLSIGNPDGVAGNPTLDVVALRETSGPTTLTMGAIPTGQCLSRSGTTIVGTACVTAPTYPTGIEVGNGTSALTGYSTTAGRVLLGSGPGVTDSAMLRYSLGSLLFGDTTARPRLIQTSQSGLSTTHEFYLDAAPTFAGAIGNGLPGASNPSTNDIVLSTWAGSSWSERMRVLNGGSVSVASLAGASDALTYGTAAAGTLGRVTLGSGLSLSGGTLSATGSGVSSVTGTAGQITVSPTTGAVVASLPSIISPGSCTHCSATVDATGRVTSFALSTFPSGVLVGAGTSTLSSYSTTTGRFLLGAGPGVTDTGMLRYSAGTLFYGDGTLQPRLTLTSTPGLSATTEFWKDATPSFAGAIGNGLPGTSGASTNDIVLSTWAGASWSERLRILNGGSIRVASLAGSGTRCVQTDSTGELAAAASGCGGSTPTYPTGVEIGNGTSTLTGYAAAANEMQYGALSGGGLAQSTSLKFDPSIFGQTINNTSSTGVATLAIDAGTGGGIIRAYGQSHAITSLAGKIGIGPDTANGATGAVLFGNSVVASGGSGSISLRGGGYDTAGENLSLSSGVSEFTHGSVAVDSVAANSLVVTDASHNLTAAVQPVVQSIDWSESWTNSSVGLQSNKGNFIFPSSNVGTTLSGDGTLNAISSDVSATLQAAYGLSFYPLFHAAQRAMTGGVLRCMDWYGITSGSGTDTEVFGLYYTNNSNASSVTLLTSVSKSNWGSLLGTFGTSTFTAAIPAGAWVFLAIYRTDTASSKNVLGMNFRCEADLY